MNEVESCPEGEASAAHGAGVSGDFRLHEDYIKHNVLTKLNLAPFGGYEFLASSTRVLTIMPEAPFLGQ